MNREYRKWPSERLGREMELLAFGHAGRPVVVFPTSMGRFWDFEDRGMIAALEPALEAGLLQAFCVDSVDAESWYAEHIAPGARAERHIQYDAYVVDEVLPFVRERSGAARVGTVGCSFGGYHAVNFALKHPAEVDLALSMGGAFDIRQFSGGIHDENFYFNCPPDFLPNLTSEAWLAEYRNVRFILAAGEHDPCLAENVRLSAIMRHKGIAHELDVWGGAGHDWPWWQGMVRKFLARA